MRKIQRLAAVGALAGLTVALGACSASEEPAAGGGDAAPAPQAEPPAPESSPAGGEGVTTIDQIFGPGCGQVPTEGEGSAQGMVDDPVGTAASNNPLLTTLVQTVTAANLVDTLNDPNAQYTVFAPANPAFEALPPGTAEQLTTAPDVAQPTSQLSQILTYHVIPQRYDAEGIVEAGSLTSVQGGAVQVTGTPDAPVVNGAQVLCGNIPTSNATVFVIDQVMMPPAA
ncbi:MAG: fasciclin domain-containing protein [Pseudonocardiaceae bacterium]